MLWVSFRGFLKSLKYHPKYDDLKETFKQTEEMVNALFSAADANEMTIIDVRRFSLKPNEIEMGKLAPIKVQLANKREVYNLFDKLKNLKGSKFEKVRICKEIPSSLINEYNELEKRSFEIRKSQGGQTRIIQRGLKLVIYYKGKSENEFYPIQ